MTSRHTPSSPPSRSCLFIYRPRVHTWGPSISTPQRVLGSWDSSCDILISFFLYFHPRQFLFFGVSPVLVSYTFPAPTCVFSPIPGCLGYLFFFPHLPLPRPHPPPPGRRAFSLLLAAVILFFQITQRCINIDSAHILGLSRRIIYFSTKCAIATFHFPSIRALLCPLLFFSVHDATRFSGVQSVWVSIIRSHSVITHRRGYTYILCFVCLPFLSPARACAYLMRR